MRLDVQRRLFDPPQGRPPWTPGAVTHAAVAECSGDGRAPVYRHWPQQHLFPGHSLNGSDGSGRGADAFATAKPGTFFPL
ncbi:hypothetical protein ABT009_44070 [Streptomyces sp. NPDC002896]|uniref:hypothetical protein n=1 Tax=Streptomyces sp. NPDC002896 TaxID=3154438 RepID=UPI0033330BBF